MNTTIENFVSQKYAYPRAWEEESRERKMLAWFQTEISHQINIAKAHTISIQCLHISVNFLWIHSKLKTLWYGNFLN